MKKSQNKTKMNYIYAYYQGIAEGSIAVGKWVRLLYEYIVKGLEDKSFFFDQNKANNAIEWIEAHCFHSEGPLAPGSLKLELWQKALVSCVFGIVDEKGTRQFREIVFIVARKNGKSLLASAIAKYEWAIDGGYGAKIFCLAPKLEQAEIIYNDVWQHTILDPEWKNLKAEIEDSGGAHKKRTKDDSELAKKRQTDLYIPATNSSVKKIAFSAKKSDGFNPSMTICDEIASWEGDKGLKQYEVMKSAMGARPEAMLFSCSTAGYVSDGIYDELIKRGTAFLLGNSKEKRLLPLLYMIDDPNSWDDINELRKSNPNLGISVTVDYLLEEIAVAEGSLSKKAEFLCKYCNIKQNSSQAWFSATEIDDCFGDELRLEDFRGCYAVCGIDLSQTTDLTACTCVIEKDGVLNVFTQFFMPAERIEKATAEDGIPYSHYVKNGWLALSGDNYIDYHDAERWIVGLYKTYGIMPLQIGYDRYTAQYLVQDLKVNYGLQLDDIFQGNNLTPVIHEAEGIVKDKRIKFGNNQLMKIHLLNAALKTDNELNKVRLIKINQHDRIDGVAALLDALCVRQKWWAQLGPQLQNNKR